MKLWRKRQKHSYSPELYFSEDEAISKVGREVSLLKEHDSIPHYSNGIVLKGERFKGDKWRAMIQWRTPATLIDFATLVTRPLMVKGSSKLFIRKYSKSQFNELVDESKSVNHHAVEGPRGSLFDYYCQSCGNQVNSAQNRCNHCNVLLPV